MGSTPRAAAANIRARERNEWDSLMRMYTPESLSAAEIDLEHHDLTKAPTPHPVTAWVRYNGEPVRIKGWMSMYTDTAGKIRWTIPQGGWHQAWVWAGAYEPRRPAPGERHDQTFGISINSAEGSKYLTGDPGR